MSKTMKALPSGEAIDLANPDTYKFTVEEISALLHKVKRFNGFGMSVATHSIMVADTLYNLTGNPHIALRGLLHDASEAYIGDIGTPVKAALGVSIELLEDRVQGAILKQLAPNNKWNLTAQPIIKFVDMMALHYELNDLIANSEYKDNELWDPVRQYPIHPDMRAKLNYTFADVYEQYSDFCEKEAADLEEVSYRLPQGSFCCYANPNTMRWLQGQFK